MKYRALVKWLDGWWIGWLVDLPGVNAQEKTREELLESLRVGAEDMLSTEISLEAGEQATTVEVSEPHWGGDARREDNRAPV